MQQKHPHATRRDAVVDCTLGQYFMNMRNKGILLLFCGLTAPLEGGAPEQETIPHPEIVDKPA
jgi:hypothetical protein